MEYGTVTAYRVGNRLTIEVELPDSGVLSNTGRAVNLVDPRVWTDVDDESDHIGLKMTQCRPLFRRRPRRQ